MKKTVAILMSTYNGEKYLETQLMSIIKQTDHSWHLYVRDDGSSDGTTYILKKFAHDYPQITFVNSDRIQNVGVVKSFMYLLEYAKADFYMFSDQDDYWLPEKIAHTKQKMLEQSYLQEPICVHTNLKIVNSHLIGNQLMNVKVPWNTFLKEMFNNCVTGCTLMINQKTKDLINFKTLDYSKIFMHDWWLGMVSACFGKMVYLNEATILYRQHGNNVVGSSNKNIFTILKRIVGQSFDIGEFRKVICNSTEFYRNYGDKLHGRYKSYVYEYSSLAYRSSFLHNLHLVFSLPPKESSFKKTLFFEWLMLAHSKKLRINDEKE